MSDGKLIIALCDCSRATFKEGGRSSALDDISRCICQTVDQSDNENDRVVFIGYDTVSPSDNRCSFHEVEYHRNSGDYVQPSYFGQMKGNSPLGMAMIHASELFEKYSSNDNTLIIITSCSGNGEKSTIEARIILNNISKKFSESSRIVIGLNISERVMAELTHIATVNSKGRPHIFYSSDFIDFNKMIYG